MSNRISILPEALANQIAAGEVVHRPASVVKELVENAIDAQADKIEINISQAGKTLIQVIDNGIGMSETDARLAFERHATSKISSVEDLFNITTKGFRGEALASIASVAHVELRTRREEDPIGTKVIIEGGKFISQEPVNCAKGSNFMVKNLFFNIPARRRFLKSDNTEFKHILNVFFRLAIAHPGIEFTLHHNNQVIYKLIRSSLKERIIALYDKSYNKKLIPIEGDAGFIKIYGYIGTPEAARKTYAEQYFFVNNRYFKSTYLHRAVAKAYEKIIASDEKPTYFIFFEIDPQRIDVNIHPEKTEINFTDSDAVYQLLLAAVKRSLAQYGVVPSIDFDTEGYIEVNSKINTDDIKVPDVGLTDDYNPFNYELEDRTPEFSYNKSSYNSNQDAGEIYKILESRESARGATGLFDEKEEEKSVAEEQFISFGSKYVLTPIQSGIMIIHQQRAYETIFYDEIMDKLGNENIASQQTLYPVMLNLTHQEKLVFDRIKSQLEQIGFRFEQVGDLSINITGIPAFTEISNADQVIKEFISDSFHVEVNLIEENKKMLAKILAKNKAAKKNKRLTHEEMLFLVNKLLASSSPTYSPSGKKNFHIIPPEDMDKFFI